MTFLFCEHCFRERWNGNHEIEFYLWRAKGEDVGWTSSFQEWDLLGVYERSQYAVSLHHFILSVKQWCGETTRMRPSLPVAISPIRASNEQPEMAWFHPDNSFLSEQFFFPQWEIISSITSFMIHRTARPIKTFLRSTQIQQVTITEAQLGIMLNVENLLKSCTALPTRVQSSP